MRDRVIVFVKTPRIGQVKSRLAKSIGISRALRLYRQLLIRLFSQLTTSTNYRIVCYLCGGIFNHRQFIRRTANHQMAYKLQNGQHLGERMYHALRDELKWCSRVVLIGSDCPQMDSAYIESALSMLQHPQDIVLGPSNDGGYVLIGMCKPNEKLFRQVNWGGPQVLQKTLEIAQDCRLNVHLLPPLIDVDCIEDLDMLTINQGKVNRVIY